MKKFAVMLLVVTLVLSYACVGYADSADVCNQLELLLAIIGNDDANAKVCVYYDANNDTYYGYYSGDLLLNAYYAYEYDYDSYEQIIGMLDLPYQCIVAYCQYYDIHSNVVIKYTTDFYSSGLFLYLIAKQDISSDTPEKIECDVFSYAATYGVSEDVLQASEFYLDSSIFSSHTVKYAKDILSVSGLN